MKGWPSLDQISGPRGLDQVGLGWPFLTTSLTLYIFIICLELQYKIV